MLQRLSLVSALLLVLCCAGCVGGKRADNNSQAMEISFEWNGNAGSLSSPNPEIFVKNVPPGTAFMDVRMRDLNNPYDHGGGIVKYDGSGVIPAGSLSKYRGPQPPANAVHTYKFFVKALGEDKSTVLGEASAARRYP